MHGSDLDQKAFPGSANSLGSCFHHRAPSAPSSRRHASLILTGGWVGEKKGDFSLEGVLLLRLIPPCVDSGWWDGHVSSCCCAADSVSSSSCRTSHRSLEQRRHGCKRGSIYTGGEKTDLQFWSVPPPPPHHKSQDFMRLQAFCCSSCRICPFMRNASQSKQNPNS